MFSRFVSICCSICSYLFPNSFLTVSYVVPILFEDSAEICRFFFSSAASELRQTLASLLLNFCNIPGLCFFYVPFNYFPFNCFDFLPIVLF